MGGLKSVGRENIPKSGPVILAPNHLSHADPPAVACATARHLLFMAKSELFVGIFGRLIFSVGAFPVDREGADAEAVRKAITILKQGGALVLFPEGSRGDGKTLGSLSKGVALLAKTSHAQVVPVYVTGTQRLLPKGKAKPSRSRVTVSFGKPFTYEETAIGDAKPTAQAFSHYLGERIVDLARSQGAEIRHSEPEPAELAKT